MKALVVVIAAILSTLMVFQVASMALFSNAATAHSFPAQLASSTGERIYRGFERVSPSDTVEAMLARSDLRNARFADAQQRIARMTPGSERSELEAQLAVAQRQTERALRAYLVADDVDALQFEVDRLEAGHRLRDAYAFEHRIVEHLASQTTHPDALAEAWWRQGQLASRLATDASARQKWLRDGQNDYEHALALALFSEKYLLAAGFQALKLRNLIGASTYFTRGIDVDPASAEAYAGLAEVALAGGDRARSKQYAERSRALNANTQVLRDVEQKLAASSK